MSFVLRWLAWECLRKFAWSGHQDLELHCKLVPALALQEPLEEIQIVTWAGFQTALSVSRVQKHLCGENYSENHLTLQFWLIILSEFLTTARS